MFVPSFLVSPRTAAWCSNRTPSPATTTPSDGGSSKVVWWTRAPGRVHRQPLDGDAPLRALRHARGRPVPGAVLRPGPGRRQLRHLGGAGRAALHRDVRRCHRSPTDFDDSSPQMVFPRSFLGAHPDVGVVQTIIAAHLAPGVDPATSWTRSTSCRTVTTRTRARALRRIVSDSAGGPCASRSRPCGWSPRSASLAATVVVAQVVSRTLRVSDEERESMAALGWRRRDLAVERAVEGGIAAIGAAPIAGLVAVRPHLEVPARRAAVDRGGPRSPRGLARDRGRHRRARWRRGGAPPPSSGCAAHAPRAARDKPGALTSSRFARGAGMPLSVGARFASSGARGRPWGSLLAGAIGVAGVGRSPVRRPEPRRAIVDRPDRWGVNYDRLFGNPYAPTRRRHRRADPRQPGRRRRHGRRHRLGHRRRRRHADARVHQREGRPRPDRAPMAAAPRARARSGSERRSPATSASASATRSR